MSKEKILQIKNLKQYFKLDKKNIIKAVDDISFDIYKGEIFGLVGESGSGKSTIGKCIMNIYKPTDGNIVYRDKCITNTRVYKKEKFFINKNIQLIFQDSTSALNPRMKVGDIIAEPLKIQKIYKNKEERYEKVKRVLSLVGLDENIINKYPSEFSGGQRQRIQIARSICIDPEFIIADEPIASLDVSIQAQIVNLFKKLKKESNLTCLFIAHDLSMIKHISDRIGVMYNGKLVELATADELYSNPIHPYTKSLLSSIPIPDPKRVKAREKIKYSHTIHDYSKEKPEWTEVYKDHYVYLAKNEIQLFDNKLNIV